MTEPDHKLIVARLGADKRRALLDQNNHAGLWRLGVQFSAIALCSLWIIARAPFYPAVMVVEGILAVFLFTALHETIHRTAFRSDHLNRLASLVCGFVVFLPPKWFRYFHFAHHRFTQDEKNDPELMTPKPATTGQYLLYLSGLPDWWSRLGMLGKNALFENHDRFVPERARAGIRREALGYCAAYFLVFASALYAGWSDIFYIWLVPLLLGNPFLRAFLLAEHAHCPQVASMLANTRTTFTSALVRFIAWNMPYHTEHHVWPAVPFHNLPKFHEVLKTHLVNTANGYSAFNREYVHTLVTRPL